MTSEHKIAQVLKQRIVALGGECRKISWEGRANAPDLLILINGQHFFVETKAPGQVPRPAQTREFERLRTLGGCAVIVISCPEEIDNFLKLVKGP